MPVPLPSTNRQPANRQLANRQPLKHPPEAAGSAMPIFLLLIASISSILLLLVGGSLFLFPTFARAYWLWPLTPFNTRFLGAIYLTALVALVSLILARRETLVRLILPMMWIFTTVILMTSCLWLEQFTVTRRATDIWFWLYLVDCVGASYYLGYYRQKSFVGLMRLPSWGSVYLRLQATFLGAYGLGLLLSPGTVGAFWPWPLDLFHAQIYSAVALTGAVGAAVLSRGATTRELTALGLIQIAFSSSVLTGVWMVDGAVRKIDWGLFGTWVWMGAIALLGIVGVALIAQARLLTVRRRKA